MARTKKKPINQTLINALEKATSFGEKLAICRVETGNLNNRTLYQILQNNPDLDADTLKKEKEAGRQDRVKHAEQQRVFEENRQLKSELAKLTPTKRLDLILKHEKKWTNHKNILNEFSISQEIIENRKTDLAARKAEKSNKEKEKVEQLISQNAFSEIDAKIFLTEDESRPVSISLNIDDLTSGTPDAVKDRVRYAIAKAFKGTVEKYHIYPHSRPSKSHIVLTASLPVFTRISKDSEKIKTDITAIQNFKPGFIEHINTPQAADLSGLSRATFDAAVEAGIIPIASTEDFSKWGRTLTANRFEIRDILDVMQNGELDRFQRAREIKKKVERKKSAKRAQETRTWRTQLQNYIAQDTRHRTRQIVRETKSFASAHHLELFTWAQRASCLAKTKPSQSQAAYDLKSDALLALHAAQALNITFIDAHREILKKKCTHHKQHSHHIENLYYCKECQFEKDHYYSLYFTTLKESADAGGLHMPYILGRAHGMPDNKTLNSADHDRTEVYGPKLNEDEIAIFSLPKIAHEIERLIRFVLPDVTQ
jgi:NCAIR mutase (PurE)-related protein